MLTHLRLQNFKSWKDTGDIALRPITGIFGANSSGKSALIQALLLLKQTAESSDRNLTLHFGDRSALTDLGDFRSVVHTHRTDAAIEMSIGWHREEQLSIRDTTRLNTTIAASNDLSYNLRAEQAHSRHDTSVSTAEMSYRVGDAEFGMRRQAADGKFDAFSNCATFNFVRSVGRPWPLPKPVKCYVFPDETRAYFQNAGFVADLSLALEERLRSIYYLGPLRAHPERRYVWTGEQPTDMGHAGELAIAAMLSSARRDEKISLGKGRKRRTLEEHVAHWLRDLDLIHDFRIERLTDDSPVYQVKVRKSKNGPETLITDVGFGVSQILPVLTLCFYAPTGSTIILEQPEIHLHPSVQSGLADVLIDAHRKRRVQIVLESHSEHLLRRLQRRIAEERILDRNVAIYFCESRASQSQITQLELDMFGLIKNWPTDFFGNDFGEIAETHKAILRRKGSDAAG